MAANGNLIFQDTNKATFVGANSNVVIDTVHASLGIGVDVNGPTSNLHVVGNAYVSSNLEVGTGNLFVDTITSNVGIGTNTPLDTLHINGGTRFAGHIIPTTNATFDVGSAENKVRDLYVDTNSLWIGDLTKIAFERGKMKFKRRKVDKVPRMLVDLAIQHGRTNESDVETHAIAYAQTKDSSISSLADLKLQHWRDYAKTFDETKAVSDIFVDNDEDYEAVTASEAFMEVGSNIFTEHSLSIGKSTDPTVALDVVGTIKASTGFSGSGAGLTSLNAGNISSGTIDAARIPTLNQNTTGQAGTIAGQANSATITASDAAGNSTIVRRSSSGYIFSNYINTTDNAVTSGVTAIMCKQGNDYHRSADAGSIRTFLGLANSATIEATTEDTANKIAQRNSSGDIFARLFRSDYQNQSDCGAAIAFRNSTTDNYIRFCSDMGAVRSRLGLGTFATKNDGNYNIHDGWLRENGDNAHFKMYANSRTMVFRTDGTTAYGNNGSYPFIWLYGGDDASSNRKMILHTNGDLWTNTYGWLHDKFHPKMGDNYEITTTNFVFQKGNAGIASHISYGTNGDWYIRSNNSAGKVIIQDTGGRVGIGTAAPRNLLELMTTGNDTGLLHLFKTTGNGVGIDFCDQNSFLQKGYLRYHHQDNQAFGARNCFRFSSTETTETMAIGGSLQIGVDGKDIGYMTNSTASGRKNLFIQSTFGGNTSQSHGWWIGAQNQTPTSSDNDLYFAVVRSGTVKLCGTMLDQLNSQLNFTGQHRTFVKDTPTSQLDTKEGLIVSADQNEFVKMSGGVAYGKDAITINESLPLVSLSIKSNDKKCFGVLSTTEDPEIRKEVHGNFASNMSKEDGDTRVYVNSVGEGAIWVTNINGTLESGDYITTSNVAGYGMKQDDDILHNYTVAKILMDCDFNPVTQPKRIIRKESRMIDYWIRYGDVKITEEEYQTLPETKRKIVEDVHYRIDQMEVMKEDPEKDTFVYEQREEMVNVLNEHGEFQWEDTDEVEPTYNIRYLLPDGTQISEEDYTTKLSANEEVYISAFVGCTYHCG